MLNLEPYRLPLAPIPAPARRSLDQGVLQQDFPPAGLARSLLIDRRDTYPDGVRRSRDGTALVLCTTELPGVTPAMIDWWFGWHLPETERYKLWHPKAHVKARCKEDRSQLSDDRARYIGNVSYVDEYIGSALQRLEIAFQTPVSFGMTELDARGAIAICARTSDRIRASEGGRLVHLVLPTPAGSEMHSAFWLGEIHNRIPFLGKVISRVVNTPSMRRLVISDRFLLDLFEHCSEEMNHLGKFLPNLYRDVQSSTDHSALRPQSVAIK